MMNGWINECLYETLVLTLMGKPIFNGQEPPVSLSLPLVVLALFQE